MKAIKLLLQICLITVSLFFFSCEGDNGEPGPEGPQGEQGIAGEDGQDGSDGQDGEDGKTNSFYFQDGFKGYDGMKDVTIYNQADFFVSNSNFDIPTPNSKSLLILKGNYSPNVKPDSIHTLMKFNDLKQIIDEQFGADICTDEFFINEAIIYLSGYNESSVISRRQLQVGFYSQESPVFDVDFVKWKMANETVVWDSVGGKEEWLYNDPVSDFDFYGLDGYNYPINDFLISRMPIYVPRQVVKDWLCEKNPGFLLSYDRDDTLQLSSIPARMITWIPVPCFT